MHSASHNVLIPQPHRSLLFSLFSHFLLLHQRLIQPLFTSLFLLKTILEVSHILFVWMCLIKSQLECTLITELLFASFSFHVLKHMFPIAHGWITPLVPQSRVEGLLASWGSKAERLLRQQLIFSSWEVSVATQMNANNNNKEVQKKQGENYSDQKY